MNPRVFLDKLKSFTSGLLHRIGAQLVLVYVVLIGVSGLIFTYQAAQSQRTQMVHSMSEHALDESRTISILLRPLVVGKQGEHLRSLIYDLKGDAEFLSICVFDANKQLIATYDFIHNSHKPVAGNIKRLIDEIPDRPEAATSIDSDNEKLHVWQPIGTGQQPSWLHIAYSLEGISVAQKSLWSLSFRNGYILMIAAILVLILVVRKSVVTLERYTDFASGLEDIEGQQVKVGRFSAEIEKLGNALNQASTRLHEQNELHKNTMVVMERLAAFSENSPNILISLDANARLQYINPRGQRILEELGENEFKHLLPNGYEDMCETALRRQTDIQDMEVKINDRVFLWTFSPVPGQQLVHAFAIEITRRRQAEQIAHSAQVDKLRAEAANEAKSRFLANVSHELRTPLNAIIGYSEMLEEDAEEEGDKQGEEDANRIQVAAKHLLHLINEILDLSKIEAGKMDIFYEPFDVNQVIEDIRLTIDPAIRKNNNELIVDSPAEIGVVVCDLIKLRQLLFNLLSNAAKFTENGQITLTARREQRGDKEWLLVEVKDTGIGIDPVKQQKLFDAFVQADNSTTRKYGGSGLGLAISRKFCQMLGGSLTLDSTPGVGSTFSVALPTEPAPMPGLEPESIGELEVDPRAQRLSREKVSREKRQNVGRILVIDDDAVFCDAMTRYFQNEGFTVSTAASGQEGLLLASEQKPDLITLDVLMPGQNGWSVLLALKRNPELESIPVLMISSAGDKHISMRLGAAAYLGKPVNWEQLDQEVKKLFRKSVA